MGLDSALRVEAGEIKVATTRAADAERVDPKGGVVYPRFSKRVVEELDKYVYRLVDPRNDETFYVGRGVGNRVFDHMEEAKDAFFLGGGSAKVRRINAIHNAGKRVRAVIHRHGLRDEDEAEVVEAALIQAYPDLTNQVAGTGTREFGARSVDDVISQYDLPPATIGREKCLMVSLSQRWPKEYDDAPVFWADIYARARHGWALDVERARKAEWVVAHAHGIIVAVFAAKRWLPSTDPVFAAFPRPESTPAWGFIGAPARWFVWDNWVGRRVPDEYRTRFGQRVRYANI